MSKSDENTFVFLVGAGFTAPFGPPVMSMFIEKAEAGRRDAKNIREKDLARCYKNLFEFRDKYLQREVPFVRDWDNIEEIYTQAHLLALTDPEQGQRWCDDIAWTIWDVYSRFSDGLRPWIVRSCEHITSTVGLYPAFITTNYDVLIEWGWWRSSEEARKKYRLYYPGFQYWESATPNHVMKQLPEDDVVIWNHMAADSVQVPLVKLHGSASWFRVERKPASKLQLIQRRLNGRQCRSSLRRTGFDSAQFAASLKRSLGATNELRPRSFRRCSAR